MRGLLCCLSTVYKQFIHSNQLSVISAIWLETEMNKMEKVLPVAGMRAAGIASGCDVPSRMNQGSVGYSRKKIFLFL